MRVKLLPLIVMLFILPLASVGDEGTKAMLHVTSVKQADAADWCTTGKCLATRYTVEGYRPAKSSNEVVRYLLECVEVVSTDDGRVTVACARVQADEDYEVRIVGDAIMFQFTDPPKEGQVRSGYAIKSQREEKK